MLCHLRMNLLPDTLFERLDPELMSVYARSLRVVFCIDSSIESSCFPQDYSRSITLLSQLITCASQLQEITLVDFQSALHPCLAKIIFSSPSLTRLFLDNLEWAVYPDFPLLVPAIPCLRILECRRSAKYWYQPGKQRLQCAFRTQRAIFHEMHGLSQLIRMHHTTLKSLILPLESLPLNHFNPPLLEHKFDNVTHLSLRGERTENQPTMEDLWKSFPNLENLELEGISEPTEASGLLPRSWLEPNGNLNLFSAATRLSVLSLTHFNRDDPALQSIPPNLSTFSLLHDDSFHWVDLRGVDKIRLKCFSSPILTRFLFDHSNKFAALRYFRFALCNSEVTADLLSAIVKCCPSLERLDIHCVSYLSLELSKLVDLVISYLPPLHRLRFLCLCGPWSEHGEPFPYDTRTGLRDENAVLGASWLEYLDNHVAMPLRTTLPSLWRVSFLCGDHFLSYHLRPESYRCGPLASVNPELPPFSSRELLIESEFETDHSENSPDVCQLNETFGPKDHEYLRRWSGHRSCGSLPFIGREVPWKPVEWMKINYDSPPFERDVLAVDEFDWDEAYIALQNGTYEVGVGWDYAQVKQGDIIQPVPFRVTRFKGSYR